MASLRQWGGQPRMGTDQNKPRMNTDGHGWDDAAKAGDIAAENRAAATNSLSDPCSIRVSSVAQECPRQGAKTSLTMIVRDEAEDLQRGAGAGHRRLRLLARRR